MANLELTNAQNFVDFIKCKGSYLRSTTDDQDLTYDRAVRLCMENVVNVFEERCMRTKRRIAVWAYNREKGRGVITSPHTSKKAKGAK